MPTLEKCDIQLFANDDVWCLPKSLPALTIINTAFSTSPEGEHYIGFYCHENKSVDYFDSYGLEPYHCLKSYWTKHGFNPVRYSDKCVQSPFSSTCALYQIAFAFFMSCDIELKVFLDSFTDDLYINDQLVRNMVSSILESSVSK